MHARLEFNAPFAANCSGNFQGATEVEVSPDMRSRYIIADSVPDYLCSWSAVISSLYASNDMLEDDSLYDIYIEQWPIGSAVVVSDPPQTLGVFLVMHYS